MIVYHGSNSNFKKLRISSSLVQHESTKTNEGLGIYFSTDKEVARSYGKYIYTLAINDKYFVNVASTGLFTDVSQKTDVNLKCKVYVAKLAQSIYKELKVDILEYINIEETADRMYFGGLAISGVGREVYMLLDSNEKFYRLPKTKIERAYQILRVYDKKHLYAYMFNYNIKNIGVIKKVDDNIVKIMNKEQSYK